MPAKKAARTKKPAAKAAPRKAPASRKAAPKAPPRKAVKVVAVRVKPVKPVKAKARVAPAAKPAARGAKPTNGAPAERDAAAFTRIRPATTGVVAEARSTFSGLQPRVGRRPAADDDEEGAATNHNLLLGPRNVRPYRERKGEMYMGREQL